MVITLSSILFLLYIYNTYSLKIKGAYSLSYIDDFVIIIPLNLAISNYKTLKEIVLKLISRAREATISFNISKIELIYFYSKCTTIKEGLKLEGVEIFPKPLVR